MILRRGRRGKGEAAGGIALLHRGGGLAAEEDWEGGSSSGPGAWRRRVARARGGKVAQGTAATTLGSSAGRGCARHWEVEDD